MFYNLRTMMLDRFMDAIVENQKELIIQSGEHTESEIEGAWNELMIEYHSIVKDSSYKSFLQKTGRVAITEVKIQAVINLVMYLQELSEAQVYSPILLNELCNLGYVVKFENEEQYLKDLGNVLVKLKKDQRELRLMNKELSDNQENNKITYDQFGDAISAIADRFKVIINPSTTSVWTYLFTLKRLLNDKK